MGREMKPKKPFMEALEDLAEAMKPVFDVQREVWAEHGPAAEARAKELGLEIGANGGNCPVQIEGWLRPENLWFYFRARGEHWTLVMCEEEGHYASYEYVFEEQQVYREGEQFAAGWMDLHEAYAFLCDSIEKYRSLNGALRD